MVTQFNPQEADALLTRYEDVLLRFDEDQAAALESQALDTSFLGIRLLGPGQLNLETQHELPLLLLSKSTGLRDWQVAPLRNTVLVGVERSTGIIRVGWAFTTHKRLNVDRIPGSLREDGAPGPEDARSDVATAQRLDGRRILAVPWAAGEHCFTVIRYDWLSNTVRVRLREMRAEPHAPYPLESARSLLGTSEGGLARFLPQENSPALSGPGLAVSVPERATVNAGAFMVHGSVRVPTPPGCIVGQDGAREAGLPTVVLRVALLLVKRDELSPIRAELEIPVFSREQVSPGDEVEGFFTLDLSVLEVWPRLLESDTLVYAVAGEHVAGPYLVEVDR